MTSRSRPTSGVLLGIGTVGAVLVVAGLAMVARTGGIDDRAASEDPVGVVASSSTTAPAPTGAPRATTSDSRADPDAPATSTPSADAQEGVETGTAAARSEQLTDSGVATAEAAATPSRVRIPSIGVDASMIELGLAEDGTLEVPSDPDQTGWYTGRSVPGDVGPSVVVGHVDSKTGPAVFHQLRHLDIGDLVEFDRSDGQVATFRVVEIVHVNKRAFPTDSVYGPTDAPALRLVTCTGAFDRDASAYVDNVIVYGEHVGNRTA